MLMLVLERQNFLQKDQNELNVISAHLGNGASVCAIEKGKSMDTSMGFTPLEGLIMGTRCGDLDPAILPFVSHLKGLTIEEIDTLMNKKVEYMEFAVIMILEI